MESSWRVAREPFGLWYYLPGKSLNMVILGRNNKDDSRTYSKPVHISIALTSKCMNNCDFCYNMSNPNGGTEWKLNELIEFVQSCDRSGVFGITFGGGEPLLWYDKTSNADFYDLLNALNERVGCDISFTTSGKPKIEWERVPKRVFPRISLHYPNELDFILSESKRASEEWGGAFGVNILVRKGSIKETLDITRQLLNAGIRDILYIPLKSVGRAKNLSESQVPTKEELIKLIEAFPDRNIKLSSCEYVKVANREDTYLGCGAGDWFISIDEKKRVKSCSYIKEGVELDELSYDGMFRKIKIKELRRLPCYKRVEFKE